MGRKTLVLGALRGLISLFQCSVRKTPQTYEYFLTIRMAFNTPEYPIPIVATETRYILIAMAVFSPCAAVKKPLPITGNTGSSSVKLSLINPSEGSFSTSCTAPPPPNQSVDAMDLVEEVLRLAFLHKRIYC